MLNVEAETNLKAYLSTAALPGQTTKTALTEEFMFQNVAYKPTVYITGGLAVLFFLVSGVKEFTTSILILLDNKRSKLSVQCKKPP